MKTTAAPSESSKAAQSSSKPRSAKRMDEHVARVLRMLGETAIRLADGKSLDDSFFVRHQVPSTGPQTDGDLLTVPEACDRLRVSRWMFYRLIHQQRINTITIGRRRLVSEREINRFLAGLREPGDAR